MNGSTLILVGVGVLLVVLLLLSGGAPEVASTAQLDGLLMEQTTSMRPEEPPDVQYRRTSSLVVDAGDDVAVGEREAVALSGVGYDPAGGPVSFQWTADDGLGSFSNRQILDPVYTAPSACDCESRVVLTLTVVNSAGASSSDQLLVSVRDPLACPPEPYTASWDVVAFDPCRPAEDPCPPQPDIPCQSPCIAEVPTTPDCDDLVVPCPCAEECGPTWGEWWPYPSEPGRARDRPKPQIARRYPARIAEGSSLPVRGRIINPACVAACFRWTANKGWFENADTLEPIYHAPQTDRAGGERATISLIIYDALAGRSYDQIRLEIDNLDYEGPTTPPR
jgi:hypothetical protein